MKKFLGLIFCLFIGFSSFCFAECKRINADKKSVVLNARFKNDFPSVFNPIIGIFKRILRIKPKHIICDLANVEDVALSQTEITTTCLYNNNCLGKNRLIEVTTSASNPGGDVILYSYSFSAGKIIGLNGKEIGKFSTKYPQTYIISEIKNLSEGAKIIWDLTGVKAGNYTITAAVDDGCGFCGKTITKTVVVKECTDCQSVPKEN